MNLRQSIHRPGGDYERLHECAKRRGLLKPRRATPGGVPLPS